ncbi:MAG: NTP transferase domain-containing protein [Acidobacteria bacterium]|nr:NTP transferase domain-containing protein [Acidobacteriota bacterium]
MKGFLLAAGLGTRLLPMTRHVPKALVPLMDRVLADYGLGLLYGAGATEIGINAHHLTSQIRTFGKSKSLVVFEEPEILGTGGYLLGLGAFFDEEMLVVNGDALFFDDGEFAGRLVHRHRNSHNLITLVLMRRPDSLDATGIDAENGQVIGLGSGDFFFTGCQIVSPEIVSMVKGPSIVPVYRELIKAGKLGAEMFHGNWFDCGTRSGLLAVHRYVAGQDGFIYPGARVEPGAIIQNSVVYGEGIVWAGAILNDSILFRGEIEPGVTVEGEILA